MNFHCIPEITGLDGDGLYKYVVAGITSGVESRTIIRLAKHPDYLDPAQDKHWHQHLKIAANLKNEIASTAEVKILGGRTFFLERSSGILSLPSTNIGGEPDLDLTIAILGHALPGCNFRKE